MVRPFDNRVTVISLGARLTSGVVLGDLTDPSFDIPSTATVAAGRLWAVNLRFTTPVDADHALLDHTAATPPVRRERTYESIESRRPDSNRGPLHYE